MFGAPTKTKRGLSEKLRPREACRTNDQERLVGEAAKNQAAMNPTNTIFDAKRLIGRKYVDKSVQEDLKNWPFNVVHDNGKPKIQV